MKKLQYTVNFLIDVVNPEEDEYLDSQVETEYFDSLADAHARAAEYHEGEIIGRYDDGAVCVFQFAEVSERPVLVDFFSVGDSEEGHDSDFREVM